MLKELIGKTLKSVVATDCTSNYPSIVFTTTTDEVYIMSHSQDCCESVTIEDICGDLTDLVGHPITEASERTQDDENACEDGMWTFYHLATLKGWVTIRWYGESNGYYSIGVDFFKKQ